MSDSQQRLTITAALPYANGPVHIGHLAGVYVPADIFARYQRSRGRDILFICGSDEHGVPITIRAKKENKTPQEIVDFYHKQIKDSFNDFGISFDVYSRTSSKTHAITASEFFKKLHSQGEFLENVTEQFYDTECNEFLADRYIKGECPKCGNSEAYGDQCEKCGTALSPNELINPVSTISGAQPIKKSTKHWYLPLDKYEDWLKDWILEEHKDWRPNVYGQCKSWLDQGLQPRAVTRDLKWGVPVPVDGAEGKVLYVWFDAPVGYISATKEWANNTGGDWKKYWEKGQSELVHFIGKDNIVFHCIIFPAMLKAHGDYLLPTNVPANEFLNLEGDKISTSRNWAVWLHEYLSDFEGKQDVLRYTLCANAPESKDNDFTWKDFQARNNNELVAIFGNFINRVIVLTHKYFDGKVPPLHECFDPEKQVLEKLEALPEEIAQSIENYKFREALTQLMELARAGNKYLADTEPWKLIKTDKERCETILHLACQIAANLTILADPFLPFTSDKLRSILKFVKKPWENAGKINLLEAGHQLNNAELLFEKIEDEAIEKQVDKLKNTKEANLSTPKSSLSKEEDVVEEIEFSDFTKMDMRVGTVLEAEKVPKTDKLLKLKVDLGNEERVIVSGIANYYLPENIVGKQVTVLANLQPRKIRGIESKGMILMAEDDEGELKILSPEDKMDSGSKIS